MNLRFDFSYVAIFIRLVNTYHELRTYYETICYSTLHKIF